MGAGRAWVGRRGNASARPLRPLGGWDLISRGRFEARHHGHVWTVDLDYFDFGEKPHLYRDGVEVDVQKSPASSSSARAGRPEAWRLRWHASVPRPAV